MFTKRLLTISLLLPLVAISATARAGSTITDKSYWPSEVRQQQTVQARTAASPSEKNSAFAYQPAPSRLQPATNTNNSGSTWGYHGGPKSPR